MPPPESEQSRWFETHLRPHEPMLRAWLQSMFSGGCEVDDVVQEAYLRVLQARERAPMHSPKAFLFATARNLAYDQFRRTKVARTDSLASFDEVDVLDGADDIPEIVARNQELEILTQAIQSLPDRCRQVFTLRKVYGMSQGDIARKLGISEHTVSAQLTIGVHKCTDYMARVRRERQA